MASAWSDRAAARRLSVHDRELAVVGYELASKLQPGPGRRSAILAPEAILEALSVGVQRAMGNPRLFVAVDPMAVLEAEWVSLLPPRSVIMVAPDVGEDPDVLARCRQLADAGYGIALDGDGPQAWTEEMRSVAAFLTFDGATVSIQDARRMVAQCRRYDVRLLARDVRTRRQLSLLLSCGVDLFQGAALDAPSVVSAQPVGAFDPDRLRTAAKLLGEFWDFHDLEDFLRTKPGMTRQVLQLAAVGRAGETRRTVRNLREALVLAGTWRIQLWIAFLLATPESEVSAEAVTAALARARLCEIIAPVVGESARTAFAAGMISAFDTLMQVSAEQLAQTLPLSDELREAAFGETTPLARLVRDVADYQRGTVACDGLSDIPTAQLDTSLASALHWAWDATNALK
jgi:c-di-GMP phosphodiesterase